MGDRYGSRYPPRARSPPLFNPGRTSLPINITGYAPPHEGHLHTVPASRREVITDPRSSNNSVSNTGTITTTYKIKSDAPTRGNSVREGSRTRRSTLDNNSRPPVTAVVMTTPRHRPVVHSGGGPRPTSPTKNPYRSSEEEYVAIPATSRQGHQHHRKHHSSHLDSGDLNRISSERDGGRLRVAPVREHAYTTRTRPTYTGTVARHQENAADDYGDNGYLYTKPGDLAQYDLDHNEPVYRRRRKDSVDGGRVGRPNSITGYGDLVPRSYDTRERGPPPSTRGFDKIRVPTWDQPSVRMPVPQPPLDPVHRSSPFDPIEPPRRSNSRVRASTYHDRDPRRGPREEIYEVKENHRRPHRRERYDDSVEQRGFGIRTDRPERVERIERSEREPNHRPERVERAERPERSERSERTEPDRHKEHKSRDVLATGLSIAGAALGLNAVKNAARDDREDRDDREERRREESRRERDDNDVLDLNDRDPKERRPRDDDVPARKVTPPRDTPSPRDKDHSDRTAVNTETLEPSGHDPKERRASKDERDADAEPREHRRSHRPDTFESQSDDTSASEETASRPRRERHLRDHVAGQAAFNPKDTMDLKALKDALNSKDTPKANSGETRSRTPRESVTKDALEVAEIRKDLKDDRRSREPLAQTENKQLRVVSPPREKPEEKPVKGILRQPREKFPEDPAPIREGVAPLKDAKKDGIPPDARWTKISRRLVNPEALEAGKERFEAREDFVIVLRVLSKDEVQGYAEVTQRIRAAREELEEIEANERRKARRARHERHKRERNGEIPHSERRQHRRSGRDRDSESHSESDSSETDYDDDRVSDKPKMLEAPRKKATFDEALRSGGLGDIHNASTGPPLTMGNLKETGPGQYSGYVRNPPPPLSAVAPRKESK